MNVSAREIQAAGGLAKWQAKFERAKRTCTHEEWVKGILPQEKGKKKTTSPTEHEEQVEVMAFWEETCSEYNLFPEHLFAIPNGGKRAMKTANDLKAEGVRPGVPDLFLAVPNMSKHGLFIEMKRQQKSKSVVSEEQKAYHQLLQDGEYEVVVCYGAEQAKQAIVAYCEGM